MPDPHSRHQLKLPQTGHAISIIPGSGAGHFKSTNLVTLSEAAVGYVSAGIVTLQGRRHDDGSLGILQQHISTRKSGYEWNLLLKIKGGLVVKGVWLGSRLQTGVGGKVETSVAVKLSYRCELVALALKGWHVARLLSF